MNYEKFAIENALIASAIDDTFAAHDITTRELPRCKVCGGSMQLVGPMVNGDLYQCRKCKSIEVL